MRAFLVTLILTGGLATAMGQSYAATGQAEQGGHLSTAAGVTDLPEPMVFDLVRPLGAKRGEVEVNVLGLVRMRRNVPLRETPDPLGLLPGNGKLSAVELSPEVEAVLWDGFAVEFEVPLEDTEVAAIKPAVQWTIGTAFGGRYIHGLQFIGQYEFDPRVWAPTLMYIGGTRFTPRVSLIGMVGGRGEVGEAGTKQAQVLANLAPFVDLNPRVVAGMEINFGQVVQGRSDLLVMPQVHYDWSHTLSLQAGLGTRFVRDALIPQFTFRLIKEY